MGFEFTSAEPVPDQMLVKDEAFKMDRKGQKERVGVCWFPQDGDGNWDESRVKFKGEHCHFIKGMGYVITNPEIDEVVGEPGRPRAGTIVVHYETNKKGEPLEPLSFEVKYWYLGGSKVETLMEHNASRPLHKVDLVAKCTNPDYQSMEFYPQTEALWLLDSTVKKQVLSKVRVLAKQLRVGRKVTADEVREHLGIEVEASNIGGADDVGDQDFDDMLDNV
jgi:hypothetical protein